MLSHQCRWNFARLKGSPPTGNLVSVLVISGGGDWPPPGFSSFHQGNRLKIGKMYETLNAMVINRLLWDFAHILLHPSLMCNSSISQFDRWLVNQLRQKNDGVLRLFDSSKYLITLGSNISPCQKATTLISFPLYNPSFHLWKSSKKSLDTTVFFSWMPFKICDCEKFLPTTPVAQRWLEAVIWAKIVAFLSSVVYYFGDLLKLVNMYFVQHKTFISIWYDYLLSLSHSLQYDC